MDIAFDFPPDAARARRIDRRMRSQLAESLGYLGHAIKDQSGRSVEGLDAVIGAMRGGSVYPPSTFGLYYEVVAALMLEDKASAKSLWGELIGEHPVAQQKIKVATLDNIMPLSNRLRYQRLMDTDPNTPFHIVPPPPETAGPAIQKFKSGMSRLHKTIPELSGEFKALIREVILVVGDKGLGYDFAGGSSYVLWGALFINAESHASDVEIIEAIAHESGHSLLFGYTIDEALVLNDDAELYPSPLRDDPRPMDGIYHAAYVSARMHWAMSALLACRQLTPEETELASTHREADRKNFWAGYQVVQSFARMSATGSILMQNAHDYMLPFGSGLAKPASYGRLPAATISPRLDPFGMGGAANEVKIT